MVKRIPKARNHHWILLVWRFLDPGLGTGFYVCLPQRLYHWVERHSGPAPIHNPLAAGACPLSHTGSWPAFLGLYLLTSGDQAQGLPFNFGDMLTLVCAVFWAGHILALGRYSPGADAFWLTFIQLLTAGIGSFTGAGLSGTLSLALPGEVYGAALYLAIACTILAYLGQTWAQARTTPTRTAIILTMEPVFAAFFAWWWLGERLGLWG